MYNPEDVTQVNRPRVVYVRMRNVLSRNRCKKSSCDSRDESRNKENMRPNWSGWMKRYRRWGKPLWILKYLKKMTQSLEQRKQDLENARVLAGRSSRSPVNANDPSNVRTTSVSCSDKTVTSNNGVADDVREFKEVGSQDEHVTSPSESEWDRQKRVDNASNSVIDSLMKMTGSEEVKAQVLKIKARADTALRHLLFHMKRHMTEDTNVCKAVNNSVRSINRLIEEHSNHRAVVPFYYFPSVELLRSVKWSLWRRQLNHSSSNSDRPR